MDIAKGPFLRLRLSLASAQCTSHYIQSMNDARSEPGAQGITKGQHGDQKHLRRHSLENLGHLKKC